MKKILFILILFLSAVEINAQHSFGVRGGGGYSSVNFRPRHEKKMAGMFPNFGVSYRYIGGDKFVGGIQIDLSYVKTGYTTLEAPKSDITSTRTLESFELPFLWHPHIKMGKKKRGVVFLNLGPYIGLTYGSSDIEVKNKGVVTEVIPYKFDSLKDNVFHYGLMGGAGFGGSFGRFEIVAEFRYVYGFSDIVRNPNKYPSSSYYESPMSQMNFSIGFYYNFIKKDKIE